MIPIPLCSLIRLEHICRCFSVQESENKKNHLPRRWKIFTTKGPSIFQHGLLCLWVAVPDKTVTSIYLRELIQNFFSGGTDYDQVDCRESMENAGNVGKRCPTFSHLSLEMKDFVSYNKLDIFSFLGQPKSITGLLKPIVDEISRLRVASKRFCALQTPFCLLVGFRQVTYHEDSTTLISTTTLTLIVCSFMNWKKAMLFYRTCLCCREIHVHALKLSYSYSYRSFPWGWQ